MPGYIGYPSWAYQRTIKGLGFRVRIQYSGFEIPAQSFITPFFCRLCKRRVLGDLKASRGARGFELGFKV